MAWSRMGAGYPAVPQSSSEPEVRVMAGKDKPSPRLSEVNRPFWEACNAQVLKLQRCQSDACGKFIYYPRVCCPHCNSGDTQWTEVSGHGEIVSSTTVHRPHHETFYAEAPILFAAIKLDEGPIMFSRLTDRVDSNTTLVGQRVHVTFIDHTKDQKLPFFSLSTPPKNGEDS